MPEKKDDKPIKYYLHEGLNDDDDKLVKEDADALWGRLAKEAEKNKAAREKQHQHRRRKSPEPVSNRGGSSAPAIAAVAAAATASGGDQQQRRQKSPEPVSNRGSSSAAAAIAPVAAAATRDAGSKVPERKNSRQASIPVVEPSSSTSKSVMPAATNGGGAAASKPPDRKNSRQASIHVVEANSSPSNPAPTVNPTRPVLDQAQRRPSGTSYPTPTGVPVSPISTTNSGVEMKGPPKRTNTMSSVTSANPVVSSSTSTTPVSGPVVKKSIFPGLPRTLSSKSKK